MPIKVKGTEIVDDNRNIKNADGSQITGIVTTATQGSGGIVVSPPTGNVIVSYEATSFWVEDSVGINTSDKVGIGTSSGEQFSKYDNPFGGTNSSFNEYSLILEESLGFQNDSIKIGIGAGENTSVASATSSIYIGTNAGKDSVGSVNYLVGYYAGSNTTGSYNIAIGSSSGRVSVGSSNIFIGFRSGEYNKSDNNIFVGSDAGQCNDTNSSDNIAIGNSSGQCNNGTSNIFLGCLSGQCNTGDNNISLGSCSSQRSTNGSNNITIGERSGRCNVGSDNVFIGRCTGFSNNSDGQIFIGNSAGSLNSSGQKNIFIGCYSGYCNSIGSYNIFSGTYSGYNNTEGSENIFFGKNSGSSNGNGNRNIFLGSYSGKSNTSGSENIFLGYCAGTCNNGNQNIHIGYFAGIGFTNTTTSNTTMIGYCAGYGSRLSGNEIFIGRCAGFGYYSGSNNVFIGECSGLGYVTGSGLNITYCSHKRCLHNNIFIGYRVGVCNSNSDVGYSCNNILIGCDMNSPSNSCGKITISNYYSYSCNAHLNLDNIQNNIEFYIGSGCRLNSSTSSSNIILGNLYLTSCSFTCYELCCVGGCYSEKIYYRTAPTGNNSSGNVAIGKLSFSGDCVNNNILLGWSSGSTCNTSSFFPKGYNGFSLPVVVAQNFWTQELLCYDGIHSQARDCTYQVITSYSPDGIQDYDDCGCGLSTVIAHQCDNHIGIGNTCSTCFFTKLNTTSITNSLPVQYVYGNDGELRAYPSSRRFKTNIRPFLGGIKETLELNPVVYNSIEESEEQTQVGFIAEEVEEVGLKEFVIYDDNNEPLSLNYANMVALLTNTIKELNTENEELNEKIRQIEETFNNHL